MVSPVLFSSAKTDWETPPAFFEALNLEFRFTLDPCCTPATAKCAKYYTAAQDGLKQDWQGERVFCNPPYGKSIADWVAKCAMEAKKKDTLVVLLIPVRTSTTYFHEHIYNKVKEIRFIRGRLRFVGAKSCAPFPSMVVVF
ncbi:DNA N-6-adenine-methyltransferase [Pedobacter aquatilis]|uniref:DNA N-6-adenine-methyltransferase n=1 Tax=Pedobacter aquatilis TaxID=351343 RepID=UPI0029312D85|nr:DNA N-6-adenine-methyltransferase [Pedobacter aquatilis]